MTTKSIGTTMMEEKTRESILSRLSGYRYTHTLGCERAARQLAFRFGYDPERAGFAALLHDITKRLSKEEQLQLCKKYDIIPCDIEMREWKMLHGRTAAAIAAAEYGADREICEAIAFHTTGRAEMTLLDKIIYLADYIEDTRDFDGVERARELARDSLERALLYCFDSSLADLIARNKLIHADTVAARNWILDQL
ncbi:MAG: HD domain-containing protein [Clostridiaceae bacterium]|nr:HD domain-containing protein [Clostridiaceae bacterium]